MTKIFDYISGNRQGKDAHNLEKASLMDPFLEEAIDGYDEVADENHIEILDELKSKIYDEKQKTSFKLTSPILAAAACVSIFICLGAFFIFRFPNKNNSEDISLASVSTLEQNLEVSKEEVDNIEYYTKDSVAKLETNEPIASAPATINVQERKSSLEKQITPNEVIATKQVKTSEKEKKQKNQQQNIAITSVQSKKIDDTTNDIAKNDKKETITDTHNSIANDNKNRNAEITEDGNLNKIAEPTVSKKEYRKYLKNNIKIPTDCDKIKGGIVVIFKVNSLGVPYEFKVNSSVCKSANNEAVRLIKSGPKWTPGQGKIKVNF